MKKNDLSCSEFNGMFNLQQFIMPKQVQSAQNSPRTFRESFDRKSSNLNRSVDKIILSDQQTLSRDHIYSNIKQMELVIRLPTSSKDPQSYRRENYKEKQQFCQSASISLRNSPSSGYRTPELKQGYGSNRSSQENLSSSCASIQFPENFKNGKQQFSNGSFDGKSRFKRINTQNSVKNIGFSLTKPNNGTHKSPPQNDSVYSNYELLDTSTQDCSTSNFRQHKRYETPQSESIIASEQTENLTTYFTDQHFSLKQDREKRIQMEFKVDNFILNKTNAHQIQFRAHRYNNLNSRSQNSSRIPQGFRKVFVKLFNEHDLMKDAVKSSLSSSNEQPILMEDINQKRDQWVLEIIKISEITHLIIEKQKELTELKCSPHLINSYFKGDQSQSLCNFHIPLVEFLQKCNQENHSDFQGIFLIDYKNCELCPYQKKVNIVKSFLGPNVKYKCFMDFQLETTPNSKQKIGILELMEKLKDMYKMHISIENYMFQISQKIKQGQINLNSYILGIIGRQPNAISKLNQTQLFDYIKQNPNICKTMTDDQYQCILKQLFDYINSEHLDEQFFIKISKLRQEDNQPRNLNYDVSRKQGKQQSYFEEFYDLVQIFEQREQVQIDLRNNCQRGIRDRLRLKLEIPIDRYDQRILLQTGLDVIYQLITSSPHFQSKQNVDSIIKLASRCLQMTQEKWLLNIKKFNQFLLLQEEEEPFKTNTYLQINKGSKSELSFFKNEQDLLIEYIRMTEKVIIKIDEIWEKYYYQIDKKLKDVENSKTNYMFQIQNSLKNLQLEVGKQSLQLLKKFIQEEMEENSPQINLLITAQYLV